MNDIEGASEFEQLNHISDDEAQRDLDITKSELKDFEDERDVLFRNPQQNKTRLYMLNGHIQQRVDLIKDIQRLIDYRQKREASK